MAFSPRYFGVPPTDTLVQENRVAYTASGGQTMFLAPYSVGFLDVYVNGKHLDPRTEFSAPDGSTVALTTPATAGDSVVIVTRRQIAVHDVYSKAETEALVSSNYYGVATGTGDAMSVVTSPTFSSFSEGMEVKIRVSARNTVPGPTIAFNGLAPKTLYRNPQESLPGGAYEADDELTVRYVAAVDGFVIINEKARAAVGGGTDQVFFLNDQVITEDYVVPTGKNAGTFGPVSISAGASVTVNPGTTWTIV